MLRLPYLNIAFAFSFYDSHHKLITYSKKWFKICFFTVKKYWCEITKNIDEYHCFFRLLFQVLRVKNIDKTIILTLCYCLNFLLGYTRKNKKLNVLNLSTDPPATRLCCDRSGIVNQSQGLFFFMKKSIQDFRGLDIPTKQWSKPWWRKGILILDAILCLVSGL